MAFGSFLDDWLILGGTSTAQGRPQLPDSVIPGVDLAKTGPKRWLCSKFNLPDITPGFKNHGSWMLFLIQNLVEIRKLGAFGY